MFTLLASSPAWNLFVKFISFFVDPGPDGRGGEHVADLFSLVFMLVVVCIGLYLWYGLLSKIYRWGKEQYQAWIAPQDKGK